MPAEQGALAPSELAYFHPDRFAREKSLLAAVRVVHTDRKYDGSELGGALLTVALLAAEDAGLVELEMGRASRLFGLRKVDAVIVRSGPAADGFPAGTIEARAREGAAARAEADAKRVFTTMLAEDAPDPYSWAVSLVERGLKERGLLEVEETRALKVFRSEHYVLPESTRQLASAEPPARAQELLERCRTQHPDVWRLQDGLKRAVKMRTENDSGPDFD